MSDITTKLESITYPKEVIIVGGGRWSRVYTEILDEILPIQSSITLCSLTQHDVLRIWVNANSGLSRPVKVVSDLNELLKNNAIGAAIVVNRSLQHVATARKILKAAIPVLVEKPVALNTEDALELYELSNSNKVVLAAGHVFQFSSYLLRLADTLKPFSDLKRITINWSDPAEEMRYGEIKSFDYATPVIADIMPHIYAISMHFLPDVSLKISDVVVHHGGRQVVLLLEAGDIVIEVHLERLAEKRQRLLHLEMKNESIECDFTQEPGMIIRGGETYSGDPNWEFEISPLRRQLLTFFGAIQNVDFKHRTHGDDFIDCAELIESAMKGYASYRKELLLNEINSTEEKKVSSNEIRYMLKEIISGQIEEYASMEVYRHEKLDMLVEELWKALKGQNVDPLVYELISNCDELSAVAQGVET